MSKKSETHTAGAESEKEKKPAGGQPAAEAEEAKAEKAEKAEKTEKKDELAEARALAEDYKRKWYSVSAEYDNFRKRNASAVSNAYRDGAAEAVLKLLPVADNFGYAYDSAADEKTKAGIEKVIKSFSTVLQSLGIEEIPVNAGDAFDEGVAEAVMNVPCAEGEVPNTVKLVLKKGYRTKDKVIRYAQVSVTV